MNAWTDDDLRGLLLHSLPTDAAQALEERLMLDDMLLDAVLDAEYELLDRYASGRLDAETRSAVERYLLATPSDRQRLLFARSLNARARQTAQMSPVPGTNPAPARARSARWAGGALLAASLVALVLLFVFNRTHPNARTAVQTPLLAAAGSSSSKAFDYTLVLLASVERGGEVRAIKIPAKLRRVRLQLEIERPTVDARYRVLLAAGAAPRRVVAENLPLLHAGSRAYVETEVATSELAADSLSISADEQTEGSQAFSFTWDLRASIDD